MQWDQECSGIKSAVGFTAEEVSMSEQEIPEIVPVLTVSHKR